MASNKKVQKIFEKRMICYKFPKEMSISMAFDEIMKDLDGKKGEIRKITESIECNTIYIKIVGEELE